MVVARLLHSVAGGSRARLGLAGVHAGSGGEAQGTTSPSAKWRGAHDKRDGGVYGVGFVVVNTGDGEGQTVMPVISDESGRDKPVTDS